MPEPTLAEQLKKVYKGKEDTFYQWMASQFPNELPGLLAAWGPETKGIIDLQYNAGDWKTIPQKPSQAATPQTQNQVVTNEDGSFDVVPPSNAPASTPGISLSPDGNFASFTSQSGNRYFASVKTDLLGNKSYSTWTKDVAPKAQTPQPARIVQIGGYDWTADAKGQPIEIIGKTTKPAQQAQISLDGNYYWDDTKGWQPTYQLQQAQKQEQDALTQQQAAEQQQAAIDQRQQELMQSYAADAYKTSNENVRDWRIAQDKTFAALANAQAQSGQSFTRDAAPIPVSNGPRDWITDWRQQQAYQANPGSYPFAGGQNAPVASSPSDAAAQGLSQWISPESLQAAQQGIDMSRKTVYDPATGGMRAETEQEYQYRTQTAPVRAIQRGDVGANWMQGDMPGPFGPQNMGYYGAQWAQANPRPTPTDTNASEVASWQGMYDQAMTGPLGQSFALANYKALPRGPQAPAWTREFVQPIWQTNAPRAMEGGTPRGTWQVDLANLKPGSVAPVGMQTWNRMAPSQQGGLQGLVEASGMNWQDYFDQARAMAPTSGQATARRKTAVY